MGAGRYMGPGEVLQAAPSLRVRRDDGREVAARPAFTFPCALAPGDRLLLAEGEAGEHLAIGVLAGRAPASLELPGDVTVRALGGTLRLRGGASVVLEAPHLTVRGEALRTVAGALTEKADVALRWVKELLTVRAGASRRTVAGEDHTRCARSVTLAEGTVKVDAHQVHLGH